MRVSSVIMLTALVSAAASCSGGRVEKEREVLSSLLGREIVIPDSLECRILDTPIDYDMDDADFKIITYIDSAGCVPCRMKLASWEEIINELRTLDGVEVGFMMILGTRKKKEMNEAVVGEGFLHPVCFDSGRLFETANPLPEGDSHHTFLLDTDNKIVAVGNPALNPKVRDVFRKIITADNGENPSAVKLLCRRPVASLGVIEAGDTVVRSFRLYNAGDSTLIIQALIPSCDCVLAEADLPTINPKATATVTVTYVADSMPGLTRRHVDVYYNENNDPERLTLHGYVTNNHINQLNNQPQ